MPWDPKSSGPTCERMHQGAVNSACRKAPADRCTVASTLDNASTAASLGGWVKKAGGRAIGRPWPLFYRSSHAVSGVGRTAAR
ncbi:hypothetical protein D3C77_678110 [compost metagenome]